MPSLKRRLLWMAVGVTAVAAAASGVTLHLLARSYLQRRFDAAMTEKLAAVSRAIEYEHGELELEFDEIDMTEFASPKAGGYLQVRIGERTVYRSRSLAGRDLVSDGAVTLEAPVRWMHERVRARGDRGPTVDLFLARDASEIDRAMRALTVGMLAVGAVTLALLALALRWAVVGGLRPVAGFVEQIKQIDVDRLDRRVAADRLPVELQPIAAQFNAMLKRLAAAFERERRFSADLAHELRTPVAALRAGIEVTRVRPRTPEAYAATLEQLAAVVERMQSMLAAMLNLAALEAGRGEVACEPVAVDDLIADVWTTVHQADPPDNVQVEQNLEADCSIETDRSLFAMVLHNVLHNAATYVEPGGVIRIASRRVDGAVVVTVTNSGSRIAADEAPRVFERLWRGDAARTQSGNHFGLGLSLAERAVETIGGTIRAESVDGGMFTIHLTLPVTL